MATTNKKIKFLQPYNGPKMAKVKVDGNEKDQVVTGEYVAGETTETGETKAIGDALAIHLIELKIAEEIKDENTGSQPALNQGADQGKDKDKK